MAGADPMLTKISTIRVLWLVPTPPLSAMRPQLTSVGGGTSLTKISEIRVLMPTPPLSARRPQLTSGGAPTSLTRKQIMPSKGGLAELTQGGAPPSLTKNQHDSIACVGTDTTSFCNAGLGTWCRCRHYVNRKADYSSHRRTPKECRRRHSFKKAGGLSQGNALTRTSKGGQLPFDNAAA